MTKPRTPQQQAQDQNKDALGQFKSKSHSEAEVSLAAQPDTPPQRLDSQGNDWGPAFAKYQVETAQQYDIMYVHYDDEFSDDFIAAELSGNREEIDRVREEEEHWEWENSAYDDEAEQAIVDLGLDPDEARLEDLYSELRQAIADSPNIISPYESVRDNTSAKLLRAPMFDGENLTDDFPDAYHDADEQVKALEAKFTELSLDPKTRENDIAIRSLVINGPEYWHEGVSLDVIWEGKYQDATPGAEEKTLEFTNPHLVLIDSWNGSGHDEQVKGTIKRSIGARSEDGELPRNKRAYLDSRAGGYGWDQIAGVVHSAYDTGVEVQEQQPETAHA